MQKCNPALSHTSYRRLNRLYAVVRMEQSRNPPRNKLEVMDGMTAACLMIRHHQKIKNFSDSSGDTFIDSQISRR